MIKLEKEIIKLVNKQNPDASGMIDLIYDKKNILANSVNYISRELDRTDIVRKVNSVQLEYKDYLEITIKYNDNKSYVFVAKSAVLEINKQNVRRLKIWE